MALRLSLDFPNFAKVMREVGTDAAKAQTRAMGGVVEGWKKDIRGLVAQNFRRTPPHARKAGLNFPKSFQGDSYPSKRSRKVSFQPAGFLQAKARFAEIFEDGGSVEPRRRKYLAIALPAAKRLKLDYSYHDRGAGLRFSKRSGVEAVIGDLKYGVSRTIPLPGGNKMIAVDAAGVAKRGIRPRGKKRDFVPLFLLVRRVRAPKKLSFVRLAQLWLNRLPHYTEREVARLQGR